MVAGMYATTITYPSTVRASEGASFRASWMDELPSDQSIGEAFGIYDIDTVRRASKLLTMDESRNFVRSMLRVGKEAEYRIADDLDPLSIYRAMVDHYGITEQALDGQRRLGLDAEQLLCVENVDRAEFMRAVGASLYLKALLPIFESIGAFNGMFAELRELDTLSEEQREDLKLQIIYIIDRMRRGRKPMKGFWKKLLLQTKTDKLHDLFHQQPLSDIIKAGKFSNDEIASAMLDLLE